MEDILAAFPDRETFDRYWEENYVPAILAGLMIIPAVFAFSGGNPETLQQ